MYTSSICCSVYFKHVGLFHLYLTFQSHSDEATAEGITMDSGVPNKFIKYGGWEIS